MANQLTNGPAVAVHMYQALFGQAPSNALYNAYVTQATDHPSGFAADLTSGFAHTTDSALALQVLNNVGITAATVTAAGSYTTLLSALEQAFAGYGVGSRGQIILNLTNLLADLEGDATYGVAATGFNNQSLADFNYAGNTANTVPGTPAVADPLAGQTFTLTDGIDSGAAFVGAAGNNTFVGNNADGSAITLTTFDEIDGGAGNDTLAITLTGNLNTTSALSTSIKNIENAKLTAIGSVTANTTTWEGLTSVVTKATTSQTLTAAATTDVNATSTAQANNAINVQGGKDVSVTSAGQTTGTITIGSTTAPAGNVVVNATAASGVQGAIGVTGGKTVSVTTNTSNAVNTSVTQAAVTVTAGADTTDVTVVQRAAATANATTVGTVNGSVTVNDAKLIGTIKTVSLANFNAASITSGALEAVNLSGKGASATIDSGIKTALALNVNGLTTTGNVTIDVDVKTLKLTSSGTASTIATLSDTGATALNISGDAALTLASQSTQAQTITVTNTAGVTLGSQLDNASVFTGGAGADSIKVGATTKAIDMGAGNDTVEVTVSALGTGGSINGGDGIDTLKMSAADAAAATAPNTTFGSKVTNFEVLSIGQVALAESNTIDLRFMPTVDKVVSAGTALFTAPVAEVQTIGVSTNGGNRSGTFALTVPVIGTVNVTAYSASASQWATAIATAITALAGTTGISAIPSGSNVTVTFPSALGNVAQITDNEGIVQFSLTESTTFEGVVGGAAGQLTLKDLADNGTLELSGAINGASTVIVKDADVGTANVFNLHLNGVSNIVNTAATTVANVETIHITTSDSTAATDAAAASKVLLNAADATTVTVSGNHGVDFTGSTLTKVSLLDASGVQATGITAAGLTATQIAANAGLAGKVTFLSTNTTDNVTILGGNGDDVLSAAIGSTKVVTINGGAGNDTITGALGNDVLSGGEGNDLIVGGKGADTLSGGAGNDTFSYVLGDSTSSGFDTITDFSANTYGQGALGAVTAAGANTNSTLWTGDVLNFITSASFSAVNVAVVGSAGDATVHIQNVNNSDGSGLTDTVVGFALDSTTGILYGDLDGNGQVDTVIQLTGVSTIDAAAFKLSPLPQV